MNRARLRRGAWALLAFILISRPAPAFQKGIALGLFAKEPHYSYLEDLRGIRATGADHVSLVVSWYQTDIRATRIYPMPEPRGDFETIPNARLEEVIRQAHRVGLKVFLFPILRIEKRVGKEWRGVLEPTDLSRWQESYRNFILHYARLAGRHQIALFSVGSELLSMEPRTDFWRQLIADVKKVYRGKLVYSANWDHYDQIGFWDQLDYLALNGYYELVDPEKQPTPTLYELVMKWREVEKEITPWLTRLGKKLLFTEIGYPSLTGACGKPWDYTRKVPISLYEQALCYEAFFKAWGKNKKLAGVYIWNWFGPGGPEDRGYTPHNKPAERVLKEWYGADDRRSKNPPAGQPSR